MTIYRLTVVRIDDNPNYDAERARLAAERQGGRAFIYEPAHYDEPPTLHARVLDVALTGEEFEAAKRAILDGWK